MRRSYLPLERDENVLSEVQGSAQESPHFSGFGGFHDQLDVFEHIDDAAGAPVKK